MLDNRIRLLNFFFFFSNRIPDIVQSISNIFEILLFKKLDFSFIKLSRSLLLLRLEKFT